ncbi:MAG TPA: non-heme iron oxygenase ferredoxin subunit [Actinomycetota bacterium]|nr:non-heme iron oxygenase ferredoxin subunit [Actinomycetota bacterium]
MAEFITVGKTNEVAAGEMRSYQVGGEDIAVANVDGRYHAFGDICTHAQCSLAEGDLEGTTVICACHGSEFDVTSGEVLNGPAVEPVPSYQVQVEGEDLRIGI